jgi:hypothetical protein
MDTYTDIWSEDIPDAESALRDINKQIKEIQKTLNDPETYKKIKSSIDNTRIWESAFEDFSSAVDEASSILDEFTDVSDDLVSSELLSSIDKA